MVKAAVVIGALAWLLVYGPGVSLPRLTHGPADYFLMPFLGYLGLVATAQLTRLPRPGRRSA